MYRGKGILLFLLLFCFVLPAHNQPTDSLKALLASEQNEVSKLKLLKQLSLSWCGTNMDTAFHYGNRMLNFAREKHSIYYITDAHELLSRLYKIQHNYRQTLIHLDSARYYSFKLKDDNSVIYYDIIIGNLCLTLGKYSDALEKFMEAKKMAEKINRPDKVVAALNNIGSVYYYLGDDKTALDYFIKSYNIRIKNKITKNIAFSLNNIGAIYSKYGDFKNALKYHQKALAISRAQKDQYSILKSLINLGYDYRLTDSLNRAESYYDKALQLSIAINDLETKANILSKMSNLSFNRQSTDLAVRQANEALLLSRKINYQSGIATFSLQLGQYYLKLNRLDKAEPYLKTALTVAQSNKSGEDFMASLHALSNYYNQKNDPLKAYQYLQQYMYVSDSANKAETNLKIANLENRFELNRKIEAFEKKQQELTAEKQISKQRLSIIHLTTAIGILLLMMLLFIVWLYTRINEKKKKISENNAQIKVLLDNEKTLNKINNNLISTISHEFRTPLSIISSNVQMILEMEKQMDENMKQQSSGFVLEAVNNLTGMLNNFSVLDKKSILTFNPEKTNPARYCKQLVSELNTLPEYRGRIAMVENLQCTEGIIDKSLIRHIVRNLLVNAIKFSPEDQQVLFTIETTADHLILTITDKGIGIPEDEIDKIFTNFYRATNSSQTKGTGVGLAVVMRCVELHHGAIKVNSKQGEGTSITVTLPCHDGIT